MANVHERIYIEAPYTQAAGAFERRLGLAADAEQGSCALTLVMPTGAGHEVARVVTAATTRVPGNANYTTRYTIAWQSGTVDGIPTPGFLGALTLGAGETYRETMLELTGRYDPPGGMLGGLFDEVIGRRIAQATFSALLDDVGRELREDHESIEAAKVAIRTRT